MIPILFDKTETQFTSNGLGRLYDIISCGVVEERNGIYEVDFEYPITGKDFDKIIPGRILGCKHDYSDDIQPFDIVSYSRPINGIVRFHGVHISYRQSGITTFGTDVNTIDAAFRMLSRGQPSNPFTYWTDITKEGFLACADGIPRTVRSILGGVEGSILDTYQGEYEFDKFEVRLWESRGELKPFSIRYGINMVDYEDSADYSETFTSIIPYWTGDDGTGNQVIVIGGLIQSGAISYNGRVDCVPIDVTNKFSSMPYEESVRVAGYQYMRETQPNFPARSILIDFVHLQGTSEYKNLLPIMNCGLCDSIQVIFPEYNMDGIFKIVKISYNVLLEKYDSIELGNLPTSLASALGIKNTL